MGSGRFIEQHERTIYCTPSNLQPRKRYCSIKIKFYLPETPVCFRVIKFFCLPVRSVFERLQRRLFYRQKLKILLRRSKIVRVFIGMFAPKQARWFDFWGMGSVSEDIWEGSPTFCSMCADFKISNHPVCQQHGHFYTKQGPIYLMCES